MGSYDVWDFDCWKLLLDLLGRVRFFSWSFEILGGTDIVVRLNRMHNEWAEMSTSMTVTPQGVQVSNFVPQTSLRFQLTSLLFTNKKDSILGFLPIRSCCLYLSSWDGRLEGIRSLEYRLRTSSRGRSFRRERIRGRVDI